MGRLTENSVVNIKNKSHSVTAADRRARGRRERRDHRAGRRVRRLEPLRDGRQAAYCLQPLRPAAVQVDGDSSASGREHQVRMEFAYDGGGLAQGRRRYALHRWQRRSATGRVDATVPMIFSADETTDVGCDTASPVSDDYARDQCFTGAFTGCSSTSTRRRRRRPPDHAGGATPLAMARQ